MPTEVTIVISILALVVSVTTAWVTLFRRGTVKMSRPTVLYFGPDAPKAAKEHALPKIFLRTLLFSTAKRGRVIESMYVSLSRNETHQNFNIWVYGDDKLVRGSGLFVGEAGHAANHHFLTPDDGRHFRFSAGTYRIVVFATLLGDKKPKELFALRVEVSPDLASKLEKPGAGLYFDWGPDSNAYIPHVEMKPPLPEPEKVLEALGLTTRSSAP